MKSIAMATSRWLTCEFIIYYILIGWAVYKVFSTGMKMSTPEGNPNFFLFSRSLSKGWMIGSSMMDNSDIQYAGFRNNIVLLSILMGSFILTGRLSCRWPIVKVTFSLFFMITLHGVNTLFLVMYLLVNYGISRLNSVFPSSWIMPLLTWIWALCSLLATDWLPMEWIANYFAVNDWPSWINGAYSRWWLVYRFSILRMISFNIDYYYALKNAFNENVLHVDENEVAECRECRATNSMYDSRCEKHRCSISHPIKEYSFLNYLEYVLYIPLYLAGPIITFNNFHEQSKKNRKLSMFRILSVMKYLLRFIGCFLVMEWMMHHFYVVAIKNHKAWSTFSTMDMFIMGYWNLKFIWLKLLIIWRFFRLWALIDGIDPPENMLRCMSNNYSGLSFWRSWHRSFNSWIIRYLYVPLGGRSKRNRNIWISFAFVAFWHDRTKDLLMWACLICLFILPEGLLTTVGEKLEASSWRYYRMVAGVAGALNIYLMSVANLVGFAVGVDGIYDILHSALDINGVYFLIGSFACVFAAVQIMFEWREEEGRRTGIMKNY